MKSNAREPKALYAAVWRWHFYAGLYVAPFLILLACTGLVMLARGPIERWQFGALLFNTPGSPQAPHQARLDAAGTAFPGATLVRYQPGRDSAEATRVTATIDSRPHTVFVDAGTAQVRGVVDDRRRIRVLAELIHGTLLMGTWGDRLIEIAASLGILLLVSGIYLWLPRGVPLRQAFSITGGSRRLAWRDLHKTMGIVLAPVLAFYLVSGLTWSGVWGERFVQAWSSMAAVNAAPDQTAHVHESLNAESSKVVPWNLEQTPLPSSAGEASDGRITLDAAIAAAQREGIGQRFWVGVPSGAHGVWTIAQTAMNEDVTDPRQELTVHVDQYTGAIVGRGGWSDYDMAARGMAAGVPLHMGSLGWWNLVGSSLVCLSVIALAGSGLAAWWLRRPARGWRLAPPPAPARVPLVTWATALMLGVLFPLAGATLVGVALLDWVLVRRVPALRRLLT
jgi:uncharacterized iron-regulated membrane protein